jgi:pyruvate,water dikinase
MEKEKEYLLWFEQMERKDVAIVGGKSSSLGEMTAKTDVPVPYGYATTAYAYRYFIEKTGLKQKMADLIAQLTDVENTALLRDISAKLRKAIMDEEMPKDLQQAITKAYKELGKKVGEKDPYVAVRSSATAEDLPDASFAGQQDTYLNVQGAKMIIQKVKECYASCFTDRAVYYREKQGFDHLDVALSAVIQMMVYSKAAGVMFTVNVANGEDKNVLIEGAYGLGEYVVQGTVTPDDYLVSKDKLEILEKTNDGFVIAEEDLKLRGPGDLFGERQSGALGFVLADIYEDASIMKKAASYVDEVLAADPGFEIPRMRQLDVRSI